VDSLGDCGDKLRGWADDCNLFCLNGGECFSPQRHGGTEATEKCSIFGRSSEEFRTFESAVAGITERKASEEFRIFERAKCFHRGAAALAEERRVIFLGDRVSRSGNLEMAEIWARSELHTYATFSRVRSR
jgi:hypothetical protein